MDKLLIDEKGYITFWAAAEYKGKLYVSDRNNRGLLEYNLKTKETVIKNIFMSENYRNNYWSAFTYKNEIWFIPLRDYQKIAIYNTDNEKITFLSFQKSEHRCDYMPFMDYQMVGEYVYLLPAHYDCVLKINLQTRETSRISIGVEDYAGDGYPITIASVLIEDKIIMCPYNNRNMIIFDTCMDKVDGNIELKNTKMYSNIGIYNGVAYLIPEYLYNDICIVNLKTQIYEYKAILCENRYKEIKYPCSIVVNNNIYFFPDGNNVILKYDYLSNNMDYKKVIVKDNNLGLKFLKGRKLKDDLYVAIPEDSTTPCMLISNNSIENVELKLPDDFFIKELLMEIKERENR